MSFKVTLVLPICIKDMIPSCILAPPLAENRMNGKRCSVQYSIILHIFSPTTEPMLPILNLASITATPNSIPSKCAVPVTTASFNSVFVDLFEFFFITWKINGFAEVIPLSNSVNVPSSEMASILLYAVKAM